MPIWKYHDCPKYMMLFQWRWKLFQQDVIVGDVDVIVGCLCNCRLLDIMCRYGSTTLLCVNHVVPATMNVFQQPTITSITSITCNCDVIAGDVESAPKKPKHLLRNCSSTTAFISSLDAHCWRKNQLAKDSDSSLVKRPNRKISRLCCSCNLKDKARNKLYI